MYYIYMYYIYIHKHDNIHVNHLEKINVHMHRTSAVHLCLI